ncbi:N-acetylmuramoyl-L-alanine amidase [Paenibacillus barcinonensis]|uniref:N-acetylmuramoyl-L-alanine amidase n=1 Tax=Paenibacillus barcinonensis TaxID=198119 RepID=A0A2V4VQT7_PAEBA|nr:N-acetylmuramoyl-L-alanine amidase [Paenibacillus barcinonensis]PYE52479.1 N-acetylmuramoyl-L-alanine amidase [Paenibacillus barcinonensis]QKS59359.1 N-acetylmuramoyl-L-alanine amidase [Paenibacillus barcinonensis]QKS59417.1 N-acetylmuramoyl-L-alanine amidase [Paenibacillus barcinonensis]
MYKVWIDAGHGGKDPGAVANGIQEKDIALKVSLGIKDRLEADYENVQVLFSRSADVFLELKDRTSKANAAGADILVSIHCNAGGGKGGFETFRYTSASQGSIKLQEALHKAIMGKVGGIDRGQKAQNLHMVRESKMPAVLTENLFVDVAADANRLKQTSVINAIIDGHVQGIASYLGLKKITKEDKPVTQERDINQPSKWAESAWTDLTSKGYFDGSRPGAPITREEMAIVLNRLLNNIAQK